MRRESEKTTVLVSYKDGPGKPSLTVTIWPGENWTDEAHVAYQAFLFSVRKLQIAVRE